MSKMLSYASIVVAAAVILSCSNNQESIKPKVTTLSESVYSSLTIQPDSLYEAYSAVSGIVEQIFVEEGDSVLTGQALFQIKNTAPQLNTENARLALENARSNARGGTALLTELLQDVESAQLKLSNDSATYFRQKRLWDQNIGSNQEYDNRKLAYELAKRNVQAAYTRYSRGQVELENQLRQAENNYRVAISNTGDYQVTSKVNGRIYSSSKEVGEVVGFQEPIARLGSADRFIIEMLIDEVDITKVSSGQQVLLTLDAFGDEVFEAVVDKIYPLKDQRSQTFKIEGIFKQQPTPLYPGLAGEANILVGHRPQTITIPLNYLSADNQVKTDDGWQSVQVGVRNLEYVEILGGIDSTTTIYKLQE